MTKNLIIVAGGSGKRFGSDIPKQFLLLNDTPILILTLKKFHQYDRNINIYIVLPQEHIKYWHQLLKKHQINIPHTIIKGGKERFFSVKNAVDSLPYPTNETSLTAIHDGVRPLIDTKTIHQCFATAEKYGSAIPAIAPVSSIRILENNTYKPVDRNKVRIIQTPQIFDTLIIKKAYTLPYRSQFTDDATVVEAAGYKIKIVEGNPNNIKITTKKDLEIAKTIIKLQNNNHV